MNLLKRVFSRSNTLDAGHVPAAAFPDQERVSTSGGAESRTTLRLPTRTWITIFAYDPAEGKNSFRARVLDMTGSGALVESRTPLRIGSFVYVRAKELNFLAGSAYVRHCTARAFKYRIGLEFRSPLMKRF